MDDSQLADSHLITLAGKAAFDRGVAYFQQGHVVSWQQSGKHIIASVEGSESYEVNLVLAKRGLEGSCDCPASEGIDFCKHCVAAALAYRTEQAEHQRLLDGNEMDRIRAYLQQLDKESLIESLETLIDNDPALYQRWSLRADAVLGKLDHKALKKRITAAFPINRDLFRYAQVRAYFDKAEHVIDTLAEQIPQLPSDKALTLVEYALTRMSRALETIDDSGGFRFACEYTLQTLHVQTLKRLDWGAEALAAYLFDKANGTQQESYPPIPEAYTEVLQDAGIEAYHVLLQRAWDAMPPLPEDAKWQQVSPYLNIQTPLMKRAKERGDINAILALYDKTAVRDIDCLRAAEECVAFGAWEQLPDWLARTERLEAKNAGIFHKIERWRLHIQLDIHHQNFTAAAERQWHIFQQTRSLNDYIALIKLADDGHLESDYRLLAKSWLNEKLTQSQGNAFYVMRPVDSLLAIYLHEGEIDQAQALCNAHTVSTELLHTLAQSLPTPEEALPLYRRLAGFHVNQTNNDGYRHAIALLKEFEATLTTNAQHRDFAQLLQELRATFKQKRNFIKWLNEAYSPLNNSSSS